MDGVRGDQHMFKVDIGLQTFEAAEQRQPECELLLPEIDSPAHTPATALERPSTS